MKRSPLHDTLAKQGAVFDRAVRAGTSQLVRPSGSRGHRSAVIHRAELVPPRGRRAPRCSRTGGVDRPDIVRQVRDHRALGAPTRCSGLSVADMDKGPWAQSRTRNCAIRRADRVRPDNDVSVSIIGTVVTCVGSAFGAHDMG